MPSGFYRGVFLTVAAAGGSALPPGNLTLNNLTAALIAFGNPAIALRVVSFWETLFGLEADLKYDPAYSVDNVNAAVMALLNSTYGFANRSFGQGVSGDELAALIGGVAGVVAVNVTTVKVIATSAAGDLGNAGYSVANWQNWIQQQKHPKRRALRIAVGDLPVSSDAASPPAAGPRRNSGHQPQSLRRGAGGDVMSFSLFQLVPAVYRLRDGQIAATMQLLTPAEQTELTSLQGSSTPLTADQQAQLNALDRQVDARPARVAADGDRRAAPELRRRSRSAL